MFPSHRPCVLVLGLLLTALVIPACPAQAGTASYGVAGFGTLNSYTMSDVNDAIDIANWGLAFAGLESISGIDTGVGFGGGFRAVLNDRFWLALDYERLTGGTDYSVLGNKLELDVPANAVLASAAYLLPGAGRVRLGFGAGLGYYSSAASISVDAPDISLSGAFDITGSGLGFHGFGMMDAALSQAAHFELLVGGRFAEVTDPVLEGPGIPDDLLQGLALDWSGVMIRGGLAFHFGGTP